MGNPTLWTEPGTSTGGPGVGLGTEGQWVTRLCGQNQALAPGDLAWVVCLGTEGQWVTRLCGQNQALAPGDLAWVLGQRVNG